MESIFTYICEHAASAHLILFGLILLTGVGVPISEDVLLLAAGGIVSTCVPEHAVSFYIWIYFACWFSAWEAYWVGRLLGPKLFKIRWFRRIVNPERLEKLKGYYQRYGILTFIVGRFIPGGVRNAIFMSSGLTKMPFHIFVLRDGVACLVASLTIFYIGFISGEHIHEILYFFAVYERAAIFVVVTLIVAIFYVAYSRSKKSKMSDSD